MWLGLVTWLCVVLRMSHITRPGTKPTLGLTTGLVFWTVVSHFIVSWVHGMYEITVKKDK